MVIHVESLAREVLIQLVSCEIPLLPELGDHCSLCALVLNWTMSAESRFHQ